MIHFTVVLSLMCINTVTSSHQIAGIASILLLMNLLMNLEFQSPFLMPLTLGCPQTAQHMLDTGMSAKVCVYMLKSDISLFCELGAKGVVILRAKCKKTVAWLYLCQFLAGISAYIVTRSSLCGCMF